MQVLRLLICTTACLARTGKLSSQVIVAVVRHYHDKRKFFLRYGGTEMDDVQELVK